MGRLSLFLFPYFRIKEVLTCKHIPSNALSDQCYAQQDKSIFQTPPFTFCCDDYDPRECLGRMFFLPDKYVWPSSNLNTMADIISEKEEEVDISCNFKFKQYLIHFSLISLQVNTGNNLTPGERKPGGKQG